MCGHRVKVTVGDHSQGSSDLAFSIFKTCLSRVQHFHSKKQELLVSRSTWYNLIRSVNNWTVAGDILERHDDSSPEVKPECLNRHLVAGQSIGQMISVILTSTIFKCSFSRSVWFYLAIQWFKKRGEMSQLTAETESQLVEHMHRWVLTAQAPSPDHYCADSGSKCARWQFSYPG